MSAADLTATGLIGVLSYAASALLLSVGALGFTALARRSLTDVARGPERWLACGWLLVVLALCLPPLWHAIGSHHGAASALEIWGGPRVDAEGGATATMTLRWAAAPAAASPLRLPVEHWALAALGVLLAFGALASTGALVVRRQRLARFCRELPVLKRMGAVSVCASDAVATPFATRAAGRAWIVVPSALASDRPRLCLVIAHEAQHHRRGDLHAAALLAFLRALFFWNPLLALWQRSFAELEDLACDQRVMRCWRVSCAEYARVLLWAAESVVESGVRLPAAARGMADGSFHSLQRRILMLEETQNARGPGRVWLLAIAASAVLLAMSWMVHTAVADHRVTEADVAAMAARIEQRAGFPVLVDAAVVARLNGWVADAAQREVMREALGRMPQYRPMIDGTLRARGLPVELLSMVLAESRFDNEAHPDTPLDRRAAGIWQIIPSTGRKLGLEVSAARDERLDPEKATEAAASFLNELYARYSDWPVAIAAYNAGEQRVDQLIGSAFSATGARARVLAGNAEHARYVRAVMAALILIENPALLD